MNRCILITVATLFILATVGLGSLRAREENSVVQDSTEQSNPRPLGFYLPDLAKRYGCFLTIEEVKEEGEARDVVPSENKNLQQELEYLRLTVPYFSYEIKEGSPQIVHIIDTRLMYREGYGVESVIKSIDFEGPVNDLITAISKKGIPLLFQEPHFIGEFRDRSTIVHVKGEGLRVRDALTNFIPLEGRGEKVLWIARTKLGKGEVTYIHYPWPGKTTKQ